MPNWRFHWAPRLVLIEGLCVDCTDERQIHRSCMIWLLNRLKTAANFLLLMPWPLVVLDAGGVHGGEGLVLDISTVRHTMFHRLHMSALPVAAGVERPGTCAK